MSLFSNGGKPYTAIDIISQLAWGLGYCGMPHILVRFMAIRDEKELKKSSAVVLFGLHYHSRQRALLEL